MTFPELKRDRGPVSTFLQEAGADSAVLTVWQELVAQEIQPEDEEEW